MPHHRILLRVLSLVCLSLAWLPLASQAQDAVSSDDIRVADGLQLPDYGHAWLLDTFQGVRELVELRPVTPAERGIGDELTFKTHHALMLDGPAAAVRSHDRAPQIFLRGVSGDDNGPVQAEFAIVPLTVENGRREESKSSADAVAAIAKRERRRSAAAAGAQASLDNDVIEVGQERLGQTDWYRLSLRQPLGPGEYALIALPGAPQAALDETYDFAIDPDAPENPEALRSERDRPSAP